MPKTYIGPCYADLIFDQEAPFFLKVVDISGRPNKPPKQKQKTHKNCYHICNNELFTTGKLSKDCLTVEIISQDNQDNSFTIPIKLFSIYFNPAYCLTCHKSQGATFTSDFTIHEYDMFSSRLKYVAISRAQSITQLNFIK